MTIWINTLFDTLPGERGRPMRYWFLGRALVEAGHAVVIWSGDFHHVTKQPRQVATVYTEEGIHVRLAAVKPYRRNVCLRRWRSHVKYAADWKRLAISAVESGELNQPDCVVLALPPPQLFDAVDELRRRWECRVVVDIQDAWPETFYRLLPHGCRWMGAYLLRPLRRAAQRAYRDADAITAVTENYLRLARQAGQQAKTAVFPLGVTIKERAAYDDERTASDKSEVRLCYVGNLGALYDIETILTGVRNLVSEGIPASLTVAGDGPQRDKVIQAASECSAIRYVGYLADKEMGQLLAGCDVGLVPMFADSLVAVPNKLVDYAAAGLAVINGLGGESQALLESYQAGLAYSPRNVSSFVDAVRRYVAIRGLLEQHQDGALLLAKERFDAVKIYSEMVEWLECVCEK